ncbi:MAG TPA: hypothetical protein VFW38_00915 [Solirubrobacteraceae bacterium]|nr:hypothetical protein [Solirubrobacteraceae bacterium]
MRTAAETGPDWTLEFYEEDGREPVGLAARRWYSAPARATV